jgi:hypothetical protein
MGCLWSFFFKPDFFILGFDLDTRWEFTSPRAVDTRVHTPSANIHIFIARYA